MPCVPNGAEGHTVTMYVVLRVTCCKKFSCQSLNFQSGTTGVRVSSRFFIFRTSANNLTWIHLEVDVSDLF